MAIDKIIPRFLVADKDERLLEEGAMTDALNVTISVNGDGSEGVIKSIKGSEAVGSANGNSIGTTNEHKCIGSVTDSENGAVYWFVWGSNDDHHVVRYSESSDDYEIIIRGSWLNFDEDGFVKGDVINISKPDQVSSLSEDPTSSLQTILYFTDNVNHPRKVNVTRALAGDFNGLSDYSLDFSLNAVKAAPNGVCDFYFDSDSRYTENNFIHNTFQFALQYIYKDGEESAISPYSKLAVNPHDLVEGLSNNSYALNSNTFNVCKIGIFITEGVSDLSAVRLLARKGEGSNFFVIDEFDPFSNKTTMVGASEEVVYDSLTREYKFFNDRLGSTVDSATVNKLYDNVPLKAQAQALSADRIVYGNYEEGRNNYTPDVRNITFSYSDASFASNTLLDPNAVVEDEIVEAGGTTPGGYDDITVEIDFGNLVLNDFISVGTNVNISFTFEPEGTVTAAGSANFIEASAFSPDADVVLENTSFDFLTLPQGGGKTVNISFTSPSDIDLQQGAGRNSLKDLILQELTDLEVDLVYDFGTSSAPGGYTLNKPNNLGTIEVIGDVGVKFKFDDNIQISGLSVVTLYPRIVGVDFTDADLNETGWGFGPTFGGAFGTDFVNVPDSIANDEANQQFGTISGPGGASNFISDQEASFNRPGYISGFKAGSHHKFGVVYYDKYNRSGFVNEIGTAYAQWYGERGASVGKGAARASVFFEGTAVAPQWADRYQIVHTGSLEVEDFVQYTVGGGWPARFQTDPPPSFDTYGTRTIHDPDDQKKQVYVNIDTLDLYNSEKNTLRNYSFTKGDKLRIVSYKTVSTYDTQNNSFVYNTVYPVANDGSIMEFDVVGDVVLTVGNSAIHDGTNQNVEPHIGRFLILEQPEIASGAEFDNNGTIVPLRYDGFDFFSISNYSYRAPNAGQANNVTFRNYWGNQCLVEVYTPKKRTEEEVYYEIGESVKIRRVPPTGSSGVYLSPRLLSAGDIHYRPVSAKAPTADGGNPDDFNYDADSDARKDVWGYTNTFIESNTVSDFYDSKVWHSGRAQVVYDKAAQRRIRNGITYSDAYVEDVENLALSSFNPSLANFTSLNHRFGPINYIANYNDDLVAIQQNKFSLIPINKNIIQYSGGSSNVTISTDIFSKPQYSTGDFGCDHPESALVVDNDVYFVDASRKKVMRFAGGQLTPISDKGMQSFFDDDFFVPGMERFVSGYDPNEDAYYITSRNSTDTSKQTTLGYNVAQGKWQSRYSFLPDFYGFVNNLMLSFKEEGGHIHTHDRDQDLFMGSFYGTNYPCYVDVVSKISPSRVKVFNAVSYEGADNNWRLPHGSISTSTGQVVQGNGEILFTEKEGAYYSALPRAVKLNSLDNSNVLFLGVLTHVSGGEYTSSVRVDSLPIPIGGTPTYNILDNIGATLAATRVTSVNRNTIVFENTSGTFANGLPVYIELDEILSGDSVRGHFMKFRLQNGTRNKTELYCINTHITDSKYHHALGEQ